MANFPILTVYKCNWQNFGINDCSYNNIIKNLKQKVMSKGKLVTGVVVGAAAGAILGILFAPDKGLETRKKLAQKGNDIKGSVKDSFGKIQDTITDKYQSIKGDAKDMIEKGKEKGANLKEEYKAEKSF